MVKKIICLSFGLVLLLSMLFPGLGAAETVDVYIVQPGDSLWQISLKYKVNLSDIIAANPQLANPSLIHPGDKIQVPISVAAQLTEFERQVVQLVNQERTSRGLSPLRANTELSRVARTKSQDMRDVGYFSHQSPTYGSPFDMMRSFNISYRAAGENIAAGQSTPQQVMQGWMNSPGHRKNILNGTFTEIGVGYVQGGSYRHYWTQMFIRP